MQTKQCAHSAEDGLNKLISNSRLFANETQSTLPAVEIATPPPKRRLCLPTRFLRDGQTIMTGSNSLTWNYSEDDCDSVAYRLRQNSFYRLLYTLLSELDKSFSDQACDVLSEAAAFYPCHLSSRNVH